MTQNIDSYTLYDKRYGFLLWDVPIEPKSFT